MPEVKEPPVIDEGTFIPPFSAEEMESYLLAVYTEAITKESLSVRYHEKVINTLDLAITLGFGRGSSSLNYLGDLYNLYTKFRSNIYAFSAAKQYQQVRTMSKFIDVKGVKSTWAEFKEIAGKVFIEYNEGYLRTEYVTAIGQSQQGKQWVDDWNRRDVLPILEYRTQRDSHVRDEHAALDGIKLPIDHPFWNWHHPKCGWRCRCFTVAHEEGTSVTNLRERDLSDLQDEKKFPKVFRMNPGKDGLIFNPKFHPYFFVAPGDAALKRNNFNLPML